MPSPITALPPHTNLCRYSSSQGLAVSAQPGRPRSTKTFTTTSCYRFVCNCICICIVSDPSASKAWLLRPASFHIPLLPPIDQPTFLSTRWVPPTLPTTKSLLPALCAFQGPTHIGRLGAWISLPAADTPLPPPASTKKFKCQHRPRLPPVETTRVHL